MKTVWRQARLGLGQVGQVRLGQVRFEQECQYIDSLGQVRFDCICPTKNIILRISFIEHCWVPGQVRFEQEGQCTRLGQVRLDLVRFRLGQVRLCKCLPLWGGRRLCPNLRLSVRNDGKLKPMLSLCFYSIFNQWMLGLLRVCSCYKEQFCSMHCQSQP